MVEKKSLIELINSLRRRGFWVELIHGELVLDSWFSKYNYYEMVRLLHSLNFQLEMGEQGIRLNSNSYAQDEMLNKIETIDRRDLWDNDNSLLSIPDTWNCNQINHLSILELDYGIASLVFSLSKVELYTSMSCDGHSEREPRIWLNGHNYIREIRDILTKANLEISLAYDWKIKKENRVSVLTAKRRLVNDKWDVDKIQDDALALSQFLLNNYLLLKV